jgi:hypothetical protein
MKFFKFLFKLFNVAKILLTNTNNRQYWSEPFSLIFEILTQITKSHNFGKKISKLAQ